MPVTSRAATSSRQPTASSSPASTCRPSTRSRPRNSITSSRGWSAGVDRAERAKPNTSDHAPVWVVLDEGKRARARAAAPKAKDAKSKKAKSSGGAARAGTKPARERPASKARRPLLVIDGDSFAHRSYHALPKTILRKGRKGAGAILGFANFLLRLYREERPRAVIVGWDTLTAPTYRHT